MARRRGARRNTSGKLYTDIDEYLEAVAKQEKEAVKNQKLYQRKRGRPKKFPDQPMKKTYGEFILTFD